MSIAPMMSAMMDRDASGWRRMSCPFSCRGRYQCAGCAKLEPQAQVIEQRDVTRLHQLASGARCPYYWTSICPLSGTLFMMRHSLLVLISISAATASAQVRARKVDPQIDRYFELSRAEFSGERAKET